MNIKRHLAPAFFALLSLLLALLLVQAVKEREKAVLEAAHARQALARQHAEEALSAAESGDWDEAVLLGEASIETSPSRGAALALQLARASRLSVVRVDKGPGPGLLLADQPGPALWVASDASALALCDLQSGAVQPLSFGDAGDLTATGRSPGGSLTAFATADGEAFLHDARTGALLWSGTSQARRNALCFSPDERFLALGREDGGIDWVSVSQTQAPGRTKLGGQPVAACAVSPDSRSLAAGLADGSIVLAEPWAKKPRLTLKSDGEPVERLAYLDGGSRLAALTRQGSFTLWDMNTRKPLLHLSPLPEPVTSLEPAPDGREAVTGLSDGSVHVWDARTGARVSVLRVLRERIVDLAVSPDGALVAAVSESGEVSLSGLRDASLAAVLKNPQRQASSVAFSQDGRALLTGHADGSATRWDLRSLKEAERIDESDAVNVAYAFAPGRALAARAAYDGQAEVFTLRPASRTASFETGGTNVSPTAALSPDGRLLAAGGANGEVLLWDLDRRTLLSRLAAGHGGVASLAFGPDGTRLFSGMADGFLLAFATDTGRLLWKADTGGAPVSALALSRDGSRAAVGTVESFQVWDTQAGAKSHETALEAGVKALAFSPDARILAILPSLGTEIAVFDLRAARITHHAQGNGEQLSCLDFSPDGSLLAFGGLSGRVFLWGLPEERVVAAIHGHARPLELLGFAEDGALYSLDKTGKVLRTPLAETATSVE